MPAMPPPPASAPQAVLLVDGNEDHLALSVRALAQRGFRVSVAMDPREALRLASREHFDAIVVAHRIGRISGLDTLRAFAERFPGVLRIFLVPESDENLALRGMETGASGFLMMTPGFQGLLAAVVERQLGQAQVRLDSHEDRKALEDTKARYRELVETAGTPIFVLDEGGTFLDANDAMVAMAGYPRDALIGRDVVRLFPGQGATFSARRGDSEGSQPEVGVPAVLRRKDGRDVSVELAFGAAVLADGGSGAVVLARDVTERRHAEESLAAAEERLRTVVNHTPLVLFSLDADGIFTLCEGKGLEAHGLRPGEVVGRSVFEVYADAPQIIRNVSRVLKGEAFTDVVDVAGRSYDTHYLPRRDAAGHITGMLGVSLDITERVEAERRLDQIERFAALSRMSAYLAHEINNPLANLALLTESIGRRWKDPELAGRLQKIDVQRKAISALVQELLRYSRDRVLRRQPTDLRGVLEAAIEQVDVHRQEGVELITALPHTPVVAQVDPAQMQEVFVNLLRNALEATTEGSVTVRIAESPNEVAIFVEDTGCGMSPEAQARLFEPFFTTKDLGKGPGLGLAMSQSIVVAHGGRIEVSSRPRQGSTFTVYLPGPVPSSGSPDRHRPDVL